LGELLPPPDVPSLAWFVREAWPSPFTGVEQTAGALAGGEKLVLTVDSDSLVVFGDGIEHDRIGVTHGQRLEIGVATRRLRLVS